MREEAVRILIVSIHAPARGATRCAASRWHPLGRFNPRARTGRDVLASTLRPHPLLFQSTRPHGARPKDALTASRTRGFQSTRPHGARQCVLLALSGCSRFQSTRPHGARHPHRPSPQASSWGFNPRARTGRDQSGTGISHPSAVSIHAPARGATAGHPMRRQDDNVSIHAPARGATGCSLGLSPHHSFNPRARTGRDDGDAGMQTFSCVSIHAPARGATRDTGWLGRWWYVSIHAPARGATAEVGGIWKATIVSIHAPARGATRAPRRGAGPAWFQSTRPHGARPVGILGIDFTTDGFNPRARTGRDIVPSFRAAVSYGFNPRARTGRDPSRPRAAKCCNQFQSTRPHGARRGTYRAISPL